MLCKKKTKNKTNRSVVTSDTTLAVHTDQGNAFLKNFHIHYYKAIYSKCIIATPFLFVSTLERSNSKPQMDLAKDLFMFQVCFL